MGFAPIIRTDGVRVAGLFRFHGEPLPRHADVGLSFIQPLDRQRIQNWLSPFRVTELFVLGYGVAHIEASDTFSPCAPTRSGALSSTSACCFLLVPERMHGTCVG